MSQRVDQRTPTVQELQAYNVYEELFKFTVQVCKCEDRNGKEVNNHHISKRNRFIAHDILQSVCKIGALIIEANCAYYVGDALKNKEVKINNYKKRIELQSSAYALTFAVENYIRSVHYIAPLANNTLTHWIDLSDSTRTIIKAWMESDKKALNNLQREFVIN